MDPVSTAAGGAGSLGVSGASPRPRMLRRPPGHGTRRGQEAAQPTPGTRAGWHQDEERTASCASEQHIDTPVCAGPEASRDVRALGRSGVRVRGRQSHGGVTRRHHWIQNGGPHPRDSSRPPRIWQAVRSVIAGTPSGARPHAGAVRDQPCRRARELLLLTTSTSTSASTSSILLGVAGEGRLCGGKRGPDVWRRLVNDAAAAATAADGL